MKIKHDKEENEDHKDSIKIFKDDQFFEEYSEYFIDLLNEKMIYLTGNINYSIPAVDNLFFFPDVEKTNFVKIERLVEVFDPINEIWEPLILRGNKNIYNYYLNDDDHHNNSATYYHRNFSVSVQNDNFIDINFDHISFIFPMITCQTFFPKGANIKGIKLSNVTINQLPKGNLLKYSNDKEKSRFNDIIENYSNEYNNRLSGGKKGSLNNNKKNSLFRGSISNNNLNIENQGNISNNNNIRKSSMNSNNLNNGSIIKSYKIEERLNEDDSNNNINISKSGATNEHHEIIQEIHGDKKDIISNIIDKNDLHLINNEDDLEKYKFEKGGTTIIKKTIIKKEIRSSNIHQESNNNNRMFQDQTNMPSHIHNVNYNNYNSDDSNLKLLNCLNGNDNENNGQRFVIK